MRARLPSFLDVETEAGLANDLFAALGEVTSELSRALRRESARCGLSLGEAQLLALLYDARTAPPLHDVLLDGFRAEDVVDALRQLAFVEGNGGGLRLSERGAMAARRLAAHVPLWEATPLVGALHDLGRVDAEELVRLLRALAGLVNEDTGR